MNDKYNQITNDINKFIELLKQSSLYKNEATKVPIDDFIGKMSRRMQVSKQIKEATNDKKGEWLLNYYNGMLTNLKEDLEQASKLTGDTTAFNTDQNIFGMLEKLMQKVKKLLEKSPFGMTQFNQHKEKANATGIDKTSDALKQKILDKDSGPTPPKSPRP